MMAGITDTTENALILSIDAKSLANRRQILLTEAGNGRCLRLHVMARKAEGFEEVWSLDELPDHPGRGICAQAPRSPSAYATPDGRIVLEVPVRFDAFERSVPVNSYSFTWDGSTYKPAGDGQ